MAAPIHRTFHWKDCARILRELPDLALDPQGRAFVSPILRVTPPLVFPVPDDCDSLASYLAGLPVAPGRHTVILMQAGATSLGRFAGGRECATKSFKRYVVRGKGKAQPSHLEARGKSRYGSRLRLQNARRLVEETCAKLVEWETVFGPADRVYYSSPVRLWPSLFEGKTPPPFDRTDPLVRIPLDVPRPTTGVLLRTYKALCHGRIEERADDGAGRQRR